MESDERLMEKLAEARAKHGRTFRTDEISPRVGKKSDLLRKLERLTAQAKTQEAPATPEIMVLQDYRKSSGRQA